MSYIFLDVDGVLNNKNHYERLHKKYGGKFFMENMPFNLRSVKNLKKVVSKTNAKIILTSSWRHSERCMTVLKAVLAWYGLKITDVTKDSKDHSRGLEILNYITEHKIPEKEVIIIDDEMYDIDFYFNNDHIVMVDWTKGYNREKMWETLEKIEENEVVLPWF